MTEQTSGPAPGWYPHPEMADTQRYWDGASWTDQVAPRPAQPAPKGRSIGPLGVMVGILLAVLVVWVVYSFAHANDSLDCSFDNIDRAQAGQQTHDCG